MRASRRTNLPCSLDAQRRRFQCRAVERYFMRLCAIGRQDHAVEMHLVAIHRGKTGNRRAAGAIKRAQKSAFAGKRNLRVAMRQRRQQRINAGIANTAFDADGALSRRGREGQRIGQFGDRRVKAQPFQASAGQKGAIHFARFKFSQAGIDIAAIHHHLNVRAQTPDQRLTPQGRRTDHSALRQIHEPLGRAANESIARIFAFEKDGKMQALRQNSRHILGRMHGEVDASILQRLFDFFGEKPLAADLRQRTVLNPVARRGHGQDFNRLFRQTMRLHQATTRFVSLSQSQLATACANLQGWCLHIASSMVPGCLTYQNYETGRV